MKASDLLKTLPAPWPVNLQPANRARAVASEQTIVVLDDDPTGTQTVFDVPVITDWKSDHILQAFHEGLPLIYVLTNTRAFPAEEAARINREVAHAVLMAMAETGRDFHIISRSDSTLRGHFPLETDVLAEELELGDAPLILVPFFEEGGRVTVDDVHYVIEGDSATPAGETPFAEDAVFGFKHSNLTAWVEEKTAGRVSAREVISIPLGVIRGGGPQMVTGFLRGLTEDSVCVVNAVEMRDLEVVAAAVHELWAEGRMFLFRSAASIVRALAGLPKKPLLERADVVDESGSGGLVVVGSHVPKSTAQLECLVRGSDAVAVELKAVPDTLAKVEDGLKAGRTVVLYTSRELVTGSDDEENLKIGQRISASLVEVVAGLETTPKFLIAKGGITSSDIATRALGIKRAMVIGQLLPGVPVWRTDEGLGYVIFPGNVGGDEALLEAVGRLEG